jgi:N12 class adenine-specific DNA methylase
MKLYPSANILVATKQDFQKENRQQLFAKIATGNYDAVIIGHSQLKSIPMSQERQEKILQSQIDDIVQGIKKYKADRDEGNFNVKAMERTKKSLEQNLSKLKATKQDDIITFEEMGIDKLIVDEAHECTTRS